MRVRSDRKSSDNRSRGVALLGRPRRRYGDAVTTAPVEAPTRSFRDDLADERRLRESGGPRDRATYACSCGYQFEADVSTSVACPHCGTSQAW